MIVLCLGATTNSYPIAFDLKPYYHINVLPTRQLIQPVKPNITLNIIFYQKSLGDCHDEKAFAEMPLIASGESQT